MGSNVDALEIKSSSVRLHGLSKYYYVWSNELDVLWALISERCATTDCSDCFVQLKNANHLLSVIQGRM